MPSIAVAGFAERNDHAAAEPERDEASDDKPEQPDDCGPRSAKDHSVDVIDIGAGLKREKFVSRAKGADIRELPEFGAAG